MKKNEYVTPEMEVVEIQTENFIAASFNEGGPGQGGSEEVPGGGDILPPID